MFKKTRVKSILVFTLVLLMVLSVFAGCGKSGSSDKTSTQDQSSAAGQDETQQQASTADEKEPVKIAFWTISLRPTFDDFFNGIIANYKNDHPNVTVEWTDLPYDAIQNKLITAAAGGNSPDVVNLNTEMALVMAGKDILVNLDEEATEEQKNTYIKTLFESTKTDKGIFAFPWYGAPSVMIYNKDLFSKAGIQTPPTTFDEMFDAAKTIKEKTGEYAYIPDSFERILYLEGVPILNADKTKAAFNTDEAVALLTKYKKAVDDKILPKTDWGSWDKMLQNFNTGKLAMINSGPQSIKRIKDEAPDIYKNIEITSPMVGKAGIISNAIMNVVVPKLSKNHKEAIDFAYYVTNDDNQLGFAKTVAIFPSTVKASQDPYFKSDTSTPEGKAISIVADELIRTADMSLAITKEQDVYTAINNAAAAVLLSNTDPKKALDDAEKKVNEVLAGQ